MILSHIWHKSGGSYAIVWGLHAIFSVKIPVFTEAL